MKEQRLLLIFRDGDILISLNHILLIIKRLEY
jgi:hypothetical protein